MKSSRRLVVFGLAYCVFACAHASQPLEFFGPPSPLPAPAEARALALAHPDLRAGVDLAWIAANDRKLARELIERGLREDPNDASLRLRRAVLALTELATAEAGQDLIWILRHDRGGSAAEIALALLLDDSSLRRFAARAETLEALEAGLAATASPSPMRHLLAAQLRARNLRFRAKGTGRKIAEEELRLFTEAGALPRFRSRGPLGPWLFLGLETPTEWERWLIESPGAPDKGPALPFGAFQREQDLRGGLLDVARDRAPGVYVSEVYFEVPGDRTQSVRVLASFRGQARLRLDGQLLLDRLEFEAELPELFEREAELAPGWHQIVIASLSAPRGGFAVHLFDEHARPLVVATRTELPPGEKPSSSHVGPAVNPRVDAVKRVALALKQPEDSPGVRYWTGRLALGASRRDLELARIALIPGARLAPDSAAFAAAQARVVQQEGQARALVEAQLRRGLKLDPTEPSLLEAVARSTASDQPDRALQLIDQLREAAPHAAAPEELAFQIHARRGWNQEAEQALRAAETKGASAALLDAGAAFLRSQFRLTEAKAREAAADRLENAKPKTNSARNALENGDPTRAVALLEKSIENSADPTTPLRRLAELQLMRGAWDQAKLAAERIEALAPWDPVGPQLAAAALLGAGNHAAVIEKLAELERLGLQDVGLESVQAEVEGRIPGRPIDGSPLGQRLALDPVAMAQRPLGPEQLGFREVQLLDRVVDYVSPSGAALSLRHALTRLLSKEATDRAGEFRLEDGALALQLRTLKSDGRIIEIDEHEGKADLSFSALAPGDTIEREWLTVDGPATYYGGYTRHFFFRDDVPVQRSELFVVVPKGTPVRWKSYHGAPEAEQFDDGDRTVYVFARQNAAGMRLEPMAVAYEEYVPFVAVSVGLDEETALLSNRARLFGAGRWSHEVRERALELTAGLDDPRAKFEKLFRFTADEIRPGSSTDATVTLTLGRGNRLFLMAALARSIGLDAEFVLARSGVQSWVQPPFLDAGFYSLPLLRLKLPDPPHHLFAIFGSPGQSGGSEAWLGPAPASFADGRYIRVLDPTGRPHPFEPSDVEQNGTLTKARLQVRENGDAEGTIVVKVPGVAAATLKEALRPLRSHELTQGLQGLLAGTVPGGQLLGFEISGLDDRLAGVELEFKVLIHSFLVPQNGSMVANSFFPRFISGIFVGLPAFESLIQVPERESPMLLPQASETLEVEIQLPKGTPAPSRMPDSFERLESWGTFRQSAKYEADRLRFERIVEMKGGRVTPDRYPSFFGAIQEVASHMRGQLRFDPAPAPRAAASR